MKKGIFAILAALVVFAMLGVSCDTGTSPKKKTDKYSYTVKFYNGATVHATKTVASPATTIDALPAAPTTPPAGTGKKAPFIGWNTVATASAANFTATTKVIRDTDVYAIWTDDGPVLPGDQEIVEELGLNNGSFAIYQFELPQGKKWGDYAQLTAKYKNADVAGTKIRGRVMGNFVQEELEAVRIGETDVDSITVNGKVAVVGSWSQGSSGRWIMDNQFPGDTEINKIFTRKINGEDVWFVDPNPPEDNAWFTVNYGKPGQNPHGQWNGGVYTGGNNANRENQLAGRVPADADTGPFYLAVGLSVSGSNGPVIAQVKDVVLSDASDTVYVVGKPLFFRENGTLRRAVAGQNDGTPMGSLSWKIISGEDKIATIEYVAPPATIDISYNLNYPNDDEHPPKDPVKIKPGATLIPDQLANPDEPKTPPTPVPPATAANWSFDGWYTAPTGGVKVVAGNNSTGGSIFNKPTTLYAQWVVVGDTVDIVYNNGGGTGTIDTVKVVKTTGKLAATDLTKKTLVGPAGKTAFGGFYTENTTLSTFNYKDYSKLVTTNNTFSNNTTIYAYWYAAPARDADAGVDYVDVDGTKVLALKNNTRIDADGYFIFGNSASNSYLGLGSGDSFLGAKWPGDIGELQNNLKTLKVTYALKDIVVPAPIDGYTLDAAYAWKRYDSFNGTSAGNYQSWDRTATVESVTPAPVTTSKGVGTWYIAAASDTENSGWSIQVNAGDDDDAGNGGANKKQRAGYVYGIKIISIVIE